MNTPSSQPFSTAEVLQTPCDHLPLGSLQQTFVLHRSGNPELDANLQVGSHGSRVEGRITSLDLLPTLLLLQARKGKGSVATSAGSRLLEQFLLSTCEINAVINKFPALGVLVESDTISSPRPCLWLVSRSDASLFGQDRNHVSCRMCLCCATTALFSVKSSRSQRIPSA